MGEGEVSGEKTFNFPRLCFNNFSNVYTSEYHIGINKFKSNTIKARYQPPKGVTANWLHNLKTTNNQHNKVESIIEPITAFKKFYQEEDDNKS